MKTFKQFNEGLKTLVGLGLAGAATYNYFKNKGKQNQEQPKIERKPKYVNPNDGSIPGRYKDESLRDYYKRRNQGLQKQIDKI